MKALFYYKFQFCCNNLLQMLNYFFQNMSLNCCMKKLILTILALFCSQMISFSEEIYFDNENYKLKFSAAAPSTGGYGNEYFKGNEGVLDWTKMVGVYHYPNENDPLKYADNFDEIVENSENCVLLKIVENKKDDKAVMSFLVNGCEQSKKYFEYDVYKFEKHNSKGMIVSKYAKKYFFSNNNEIENIAKQVKENNDKYLEMLIISQTPDVIEKDIKN